VGLLLQATRASFPFMLPAVAEMLGALDSLRKECP